MAREFKYYQSDFASLPAKVLHLDLEFDIYPSHTVVSSHMRCEALRETGSLELDARDLEILGASCKESEISCHYKKDKNKLELKFKTPIQKGKEINIYTKSICRPSWNTLEGLYYDRTPDGAPQTMITQCQQWGFSRLVPCIDDMCAKCTYLTKIIADSKYTHLISNGDVLEPREEIENGRSQIVYANTKTPMAPYLFFLCAGTYDSYKREFEYPDGSTFSLELLVFPKTDSDAAQNALEILHNGVMWIHIFTGGESQGSIEERKQLYSLCMKREEMKKGGEYLAPIRLEISSLASKLKLGYKYTGTAYREIAMQNSNFGGMENVGNTTITANRMLPLKKMPDGAFEYIIGVKAHEFYHNINGSEVTGASPFELWLNEAVTCTVEQKYMCFASGEQYSRLGDAMRIISPDGGTLDFDTGSTTLPIIPEGFNTPDDLISDVTYSKAPEFVRMVESVMGKEKFARALELYYSRFRHSNAATGDWIKAMNDASGLDFRKMAKAWLGQTGYPTVHVKKIALGNRLVLSLSQTGPKKGLLWEFPFSVALVDEKGNDIAFKQIWLKKAKEEIVFEGLPRQPAFLSFCRGFLFYGKVEYEASGAELYLQLKADSDATNRYIAFCRLAEKEKMRLLKNPLAEPDENFIGTFFSLLSDEQLMDEFGAIMLAFPESVEDRFLKHRYHDLRKVMKKIEKAIASKFKSRLLGIYGERKGRKFEGPYVQKTLAEIKNRGVKNTCLALLSELGSPDILSLAKDQFANPQAASDKYAAFAFYLDSDAPDKIQLVREYEQEAQKDLVEWEAFLSRIGGNDSDGAVSILKEIANSKYFKIDQSNDQRMFLRFAYNKRLSLQTSEGREYLGEIIIKLAGINEYTTVHMLNSFSKINDFPAEFHEPIIRMLVQIMDSLDGKKVPAVYNTIRRLIKGAPDAVKTYQKKHGKLNNKYL